MTDIVSPEVRSRMMSGIRAKNTRPELVLRRALHALGFRYRLHVRNLPGKPDLVFPKYRAIIQVHGCFWHRHGCSKTTNPASNSEFWQMKFTRNVDRDREVECRLREFGWPSASCGNARLPMNTNFCGSMQLLASFGIQR